MLYDEAYGATMKKDCIAAIKNLSVGVSQTVLKRLEGKASLIPIKVFYRRAVILVSAVRTAACVHCT
jgi:hypothetical protein